MALHLKNGTQVTGMAIPFSACVCILHYLFWKLESGSETKNISIFLGAFLVAPKKSQINEQISDDGCPPAVTRRPWNVWKAVVERPGVAACSVWWWTKGGEGGYVTTCNLKLFLSCQKNSQWVFFSIFDGDNIWHHATTTAKRGHFGRKSGLAKRSRSQADR